MGCGVGLHLPNTLLPLACCVSRIEHCTCINLHWKKVKLSQDQDQLLVLSERSVLTKLCSLAGFSGGSRASNLVEHVTPSAS